MAESGNGTSDSSGLTAWLEDEDGNILPLISPFEFGRSRSCACQIRRAEASRVHALLQFDPVRKTWWLSDLGSQNGTYRNSKRIKASETMEDGEKISICSVQWTFREKRDEMDSQYADAMHSLDGPTIVQTENAECWLLLADMIGSTVLSRTTPTDEYSEKLRVWMGECSGIISRHRGWVNEYLGDAIYAFWRSDKVADAGERVAEALAAFREYRPESPFEFRVLVHFGHVQIGGGVSSGLESLVGEEVNFFFKSEKIIGSHPVFCGLTEAAAKKLGGAFPTRLLGEYPVPGFPGEHPFFTEL